MSIILKLQSKAELYNIMIKSKYYSFMRNKFRDYYENRDKKLAISFCNQLEDVIKESDHFYKKVNPTAISLSERKEKDVLDDISLTYGETSWEAIIKIVNELDISEKDVFYDLGCGSGKLVFLINQKFNCKAIGIDVIEGFTKVGNIICRKLAIENVKFIYQDFMKKDINDGTIFYMTATCFDDEMIDRIVHKLKRVKPKSKVISITRQLEGDHLKLYKTIICGFSWSMDAVYFYEKI
jgi:SAM-dependent methyltransferase